MNTYKAITPAAVAAFEDGVFERDFSPAEERDWLNSGLLELVPRTYKVLSNNYEHPQGEEFDQAYPVEVETALISGGHIERVDKPDEDAPDEDADKPAKKTAKKAETKKTAESSDS